MLVTRRVAASGSPLGANEGAISTTRSRSEELWASHPIMTALDERPTTVT
jgi:hypothetical protein